MKKVLIFAVVCLSVFVIFSSNQASAKEEKPTENQWVAVSKYCCDVWGNVRCVMNGYYPVGSGCFCYGQGTGYVCLP